MAKKTEKSREISEESLKQIAGGGPGAVEMERPAMRPAIERPPPSPLAAPTIAQRSPVDASPSHFESARPPKLELPRAPVPTETSPGALRPTLAEARPLLPGVEVNPEAQRRVKEAFSEVVPRPDLFSSSPSSADSWRAPSHDISGMSRQIIQQRINAEPKQVAQDVAKRASAFLADSKGWWTGKSQAQEVLTGIQAKAQQLAGKQDFTPSDKAELFRQLDRLQAFEQYHGKVSLGDAYVADFVQKRAGTLGLRSEALDKLSNQAATKAFEPEHVSKNADAAAAAREALAQYTEQLADRRFGSEALTTGDAFNRLVDSEPYAAHLYLQREARRTLQTLEGQREYDLYGNLFEDPELESQIENLQNMLAKPYSDNPSDIRNMRGQLASIQRDAGLSMFKEGVADKQESAQLVDQLKQAAAQPGEDPLNVLAQKNPIDAFQVLQKRAEALRQELGSGLASYFRGDVLSQLEGLANMSQTDFNGDGQNLQAKFGGLLHQLETIEGAYNKIKSSDAARLAAAGDRALSETSAPVLKAAEPPTWAERAKGIVNWAVPQVAAWQGINGYAQGAQDFTRKTRFSDMVDGWKKDFLPSGASPVPALTRWIGGSVLDGLRDAGQRGQFDGLLSHQGTANLLRNSNDMIADMKDSATAKTFSPKELAAMKAEHEQNLKAAAQKLTDVLLPPSWNPIQGLKRMAVRYGLENYVLNSVGERMVNQKAGFSFMDPFTENLRKAVGPIDLTMGSDAQKMQRQLAVSRFLDRLTTDMSQTQATAPKAGTDAPTQMAQEIQRLAGQADLAGIMGKEPGSLAARATSFVPGVVDWMTNDVMTKRAQAQQQLLSNVDKFQRLVGSDEYRLPNLDHLIQQNNYADASTLINLRIAQLKEQGVDPQHLQLWEKLAGDIQGMKQFSSPLGNTLADAHDKIVNQAIAPWLRGETSP